MGLLQDSKITNQSFWPSCDQMVLLTSVQPNGAFDRRATKTWFGHFEVRSWVTLSKFWPEETSNLYANGPESFPPRGITQFGRLTGKNFDSVFLTKVRPNVSNFKIFPLERVFRMELDDIGPESFPPRFINHLGRPTDENFNSVFLTKVRPNVSNFRDFSLGESISNRNFTPVNPKVSSRIFYSFWPTYRRKF